MRPLTMRSLLLTLTAGGMLVACTDSPVQQPGPEPVTSIAVLPGESALILGDTVALEVVGFDAENTPRPAGTPTFRSQDPAIARVTATGTVTTHAGGYTRIEVTAAGITTLVGITVLDPNTVAAVELSHGDLQLTPNVQVHLSAGARTLQGEVVYGLPVTWNSSNPAAATVAANGEVSAVAVVTAKAVGTTRITATIAGRQASFDITVDPAP